MAEKAFQKVNVISVCDDVAVTIREALVSEKNLYLILDYRLPDTVDRELVEMAYGEDWQANCIDLPDLLLSHRRHFLGGAEGRRPGQVGGHRLDRLHLILRLRGRAGSSLADFRLINFTSGSSGGSESQGYDMETNTHLSLSYRREIGSADFTAQPVTVLLTPCPTGGRRGHRCDRPSGPGDFPADGILPD